MNRPTNDMLSGDYLRSRLDYDCPTGEFVWRAKSPTTSRRKQFNTRYAGKIAGSLRKDGYLEIRIDGVSYLGHRLAWLHHYNVWPESDLDHKDRNTSHNWIDNLRPASVSQNLQNATIRSNNTSGVKGVTFDKRTGKWRAQICIYGKTKYIGLFDAIDDAKDARLTAANEHFGEFATEGLVA